MTVPLAPSSDQSF